MVFFTKLKGHHNLQGNVKVYNARIPAGQGWSAHRRIGLNCLGPMALKRSPTSASGEAQDFQHVTGCHLRVLDPLRVHKTSTGGSVVQRGSDPDFWRERLKISCFAAARAELRRSDFDLDLLLRPSE